MWRKLAATTILLLNLSASALGDEHDKIDANLRREMMENSSRVDILVNFAGGNSRVVNEIRRKSFPTRADKVEALREGLVELAQGSQGPVKQLLESNKKGVVAFESFWSSNQMVVREAVLAMAQAIAAFEQVSRVQKLPMGVITAPPILSEHVDVVPASQSRAASVEWGIAKIQADSVWSEYGTMGEHVVVANIDTGVRDTHESLAGTHRTDHGWFDPYTYSTTPEDGNGLGTHTMGTIAGQGGIGVAPGAKWIACRGCDSSLCDGAKLLACGQWMLSPTLPDGTDPDSSKLPDVVCNAWSSGGQNDPWYNATIEAWATAGILHVFPIGDDGPSCKSALSPGDQPKVLAVGSTNNVDQLSRFSSRGPAKVGRRSSSSSSSSRIIKPDIVAPGSAIRSAWNSGDNAYNTISGTAPAAAHVAGTMAIMLSAYRAQNASSIRLSQETVVNLIEKTASTGELDLPKNLPCGVKSGYPNNLVGYGRIDAFQAVNATTYGLPGTPSPPP